MNIIKRTNILTILLSLTIAAIPAQATFRFVELATDVGIDGYSMHPGKGGGILAVDFDNDDDIDLFAPTADGIPNRLYRNDKGTFVEMAASVGLASLNAARVALWFDYNGDHRLDLIVGGDCYEDEGNDPCADPLSLILYQQQDDGQFVNVTTEAGITEGFLWGTISHRGGISAGDVNNDGYLDLVFGMWLGNEIRLLINNGDGTFTDFGHRDQSGLDAGIIRRRYYQHIFHDFDGDGFLDIFTAADGQDNRLWINQQDNTFENIGRDVNVDDSWNGMGTTLGDYDNDGDFDIFVTNIESNLSFSDFRHHTLFRNESVGTDIIFEEVSQAAGMVSDAPEDRQVGWGTTFFDADNDGLLDLAVTNGLVWHEFPWATEDRSVFLRNLGGNPPTFARISDEVGFNDTLLGSSLVAFDYDLDGRLDMAQTIDSSEVTNGEFSRIRLLHNEPDPLEPTQNYLVIRPRIPGLNHYAIGAVIRVKIGDLTLSRLITAGTSFMGQEPAEAHFGLGNADAVDDVSVQWPDGEISHFDIDTVNKIYIVDKTTASLPNPVLTLLGADTITVECDAEFVDPGATALDDADGDITDNIVIGNDQLDTSTPGEYLVTYNVSDNAGFQATILTRTVTVQDTTPPELFLEGSTIVAITRNSTYTDLGATATDECEGDLSQNILTEGLPIDTATLGEFTVTYNVADSKGNDATPIQRTVVVSAGNFPIITLTGGNMNLECGQPFFDPGATAADTENGDLTQSIATGGDTVNTTLPGDYTITYNVTDASSNQAIQLTRQVTIQDTTPPTITLDNDHIVLACDENFIDPGAFATDNCDANLTESILLSGDTVDDTSRQRVFRITYTATDSAALTDAITRFVTVDCLPEDPSLQQIAVTLADNQPEFDGDSDNFLDLAESMIAIPLLTSLQFNDLDTTQDGLLDNDELSKAAQPKILGCYAAPSTTTNTTNLGDFILALLLLLALLHPTAIAKPNNKRP